MHRRSRPTTGALRRKTAHWIRRTSNGPDRRGLTGAERLLADLVSLDQFAFETNVRKLQLTKTFSLAMLAPLELERLRSTGVMAFATPAELFDQDFPGHYLRLIKRVSVSLIALVPPTEGMHATLASSGISRVVVGPDLFQTIAVRRNAQTVPLSAPVGCDRPIHLRDRERTNKPVRIRRGRQNVGVPACPKPQNRFDFRTIADVLVTIDYTAADSFDYREQVVRRLDRRFQAERAFSLRMDFPDAWWDLHNPDQSTTPFTVAFDVSRG